MNARGNDMPWTVIECDEAKVARLSSEAGVPPIVARLLLNRGISTASDAARFLNPSLEHLHDPSLLPDLDVGVDRLASAIERGEKICIHGDYDVDGVTGTALLVRMLRALGANVDYRLPHRKRDGYGIKPAAVEESAAAGTRLIVTCDCGIGAIEAVRRANELGVDVIVTDHHEPGDELPPAVAVINPKRADAEYPFSELAGVGVALKLAQGLVRKLGHDDASFVSRFVDLAALGTVGDVVPLLDENRAIVKHGLDAIPRSNKMGIKTMLQSTKLAGKPITAYYLGYVLGPRINAVGRMDDAIHALHLLLTKDEAEARTLAAKMERHNSERRAIQERILAEAVEQVESKDLSNVRVLVLSKEGWNGGVIGIVAGRIREMYGRPAVLISRDEASGFGGGSARSTDAFNMVEGLARCSDMLEGFGGHAQAAGLSLRLENLKRFEDEINALGFEWISEEELVPRIEVEAEIDSTEITRELANALAGMEPFGVGNPEPLFATRNLTVVQKQRVGDGSHLRMTVRGTDGPPLACIAFGMGDAGDTIVLGESIDLCYTIGLNTFNGSESVQLVIKSKG